MRSRSSRRRRRAPSRSNAGEIPSGPRPHAVTLVISSPTATKFCANESGNRAGRRKRRVLGADSPARLSRSPWVKGRRASISGSRTRAGNVSAAPATDTIGLDTIPPELASVAIAANATFVTSRTVQVTFASLDQVPGFGADLDPLLGRRRHLHHRSVRLTGDVPILGRRRGLRTLTMKVADVAGNLSVVGSDSVTVDTPCPPTGTVSLSTPGAFTNGQPPRE